MSGRRHLGRAVLSVVALALVAAGCGDQHERLRVGLLRDCAGLLASTKDGAVAGAELPLVRRGARLGGDGRTLESARVAGVDIELVPACTETGRLTQLIAETRWLVETQGVEVVIGPLGTSEGALMRKLARKYPDVTFLIGWGTAQEATLRDPQPNLFRLTPDGAQTTAGLGSYAFRQLGWRKAAVVTEGYNAGLELAAGFVAEFCALGGTVVERDYQSLFAPDPAAAAKRHAASADGVALFSTYSSPVPYVRRYASAVGGSLRGRLVGSGSAFGDPTALTPPTGTNMTGIVLGGVISPASSDRELGSYVHSFRQSFPRLHPATALFDATLAPYGAMEALARAVETTGGADGVELRKAIAGLELDLPTGPVYFDRNRQAVARITLQRLGYRADGTPTLEPVRVIDGVTQDFGGIFTATTQPPTWDAPKCERRTPPPWAE